MKRIGIIFDERHELIEYVASRIESEGGDVRFIHYTDLVLRFDSSGLFDGLDILYLDRMGERTQGYATQLMLLANIESGQCPIPIVNEPSAYLIARNKALMYQALWEKNIPIPETAIVYSWEHIDSFLDTHSCRAVVVKSLLGYSAEEVFVYPDAGNRKGINDILIRDGMVVVQKYVVRENKYIWRVDIVDGIAVTGSRDYACDDQEALPLCNYAQGGESDDVLVCDIPPDIVRCSIDAVKALSLVVAGVDVIVDDNGEIYIIEVNPEPNVLFEDAFTKAIANYLLAQSAGN